MSDLEQAARDARRRADLAKRGPMSECDWNRIEDEEADAFRRGTLTVMEANGAAWAAYCAELTRIIAEARKWRTEATYWKYVALGKLPHPDSEAPGGEQADAMLRERAKERSDA